MPIKVKINGILSTFLRMIISGKDKPITAIIKASAVPREAPFSISTENDGDNTGRIRIQRDADQHGKAEPNTKHLFPSTKP